MIKGPTQDREKQDIVTSALAKYVKGDGRKDADITAFEVRCRELKVHVFNMREALATNKFFVTMNELTEMMISITYKNSSH